MAPPAGSSRTSSRLLLEGTDEESSDATSGMSSLGACYAQRAGANPLSSSSSSSSSSLTSKAKSRSGSCSNQTPETSAPQPVDQTVSGAPAVAEQNPVSSDCLIGGAEEEQEEEEQQEEEVVMNVGQDVNLLSLTFGQPEEEEEEEEEEQHHLEELSALEQPVLPPPPPASAASSWTDEEQSNFDGDYMCRA
ncbi:PREDICTED: neuromodulin-like [Cyprinodon variegatus]|uniref:neuromodulin-like n=1 Tax=Cyprinodon variegatus TaxID=28743 RepID=UPI000742850E|nr:PREDICTED: neuromodulin-like [Cyprinodon variegatus]